MRTLLLVAVMAMCGCGEAKDAPYASYCGPCPKTVPTVRVDTETYQCDLCNKTIYLTSTYSSESCKCGKGGKPIHMVSYIYYPNHSRDYKEIEIDGVSVLLCDACYKKYKQRVIRKSMEDR